jgi:hypothetical protein
MLIKRGGDIKSGEITDQTVYLNRRAFMMGSVAGAAALALAWLVYTYPSPRDS